MKPCARLGQDDWRPKDDPRPCVSCGYADAEFERCVQCKRDMCFACATLSQDTVPKRWRCPDCVGIEAYDDFVEKSVMKITKNIGSCNLAHQSIDRFSQLVFDLMCSCAWSIHHDALPSLLTLARRQLLQLQLPAIMPFHSLHYCIDPFAVSAIAQVCHLSHALSNNLSQLPQSYASDAHARAIVKSGATCMKARRVTVPWWVKEAWGCDGIHLPSQVSASLEVSPSSHQHSLRILSSLSSQFM